MKAFGDGESKGRRYDSHAPLLSLLSSLRASRVQFLRMPPPRPDNDDRDAPPSDEAPARPSKTQLKKSMHELQELGAALVALPPERIAALPLSETLHAAIAEWRRTRSHEGRRRQMQFIGKLMRTTDPEPIR